ncbi:hypothetical protein EGW08_007526 [Elysia chlorotica]|uniref:Uncharacterized protein n=1 Tax=Elysia chlorotica TaxID=188477 RepID=A0A3S1BIW1_ELYCH|nr:hypothetical protein EGW08_007526 [Elysia chlorotica]
MDLSELKKSLPSGSSAYAQVLAEIQEAPGLQVTKPEDEADGGSHDKKHHANNHHHGDKDGKIVHGLHHCYKITGGQCHAKYGCNHIHAPAGDNHSPNMRRRSISMLPGSTAAMAASHLVVPDGFRSRSNSDAAVRRRLSIPAAHVTSSSRSNSGSLDKMPEDSVPVSFNRNRRGSNVILHSEELPIVYNQLKGN